MKILKSIGLQAFLMDFTTKFKNKVLSKVPLNVPSVSAKTHYSITFYTGGTDIALWDQLSPSEQIKNLKKAWYIKWWYRNPTTNKLVRQNNIKAGVNKFKTKKERIEFMEVYKKGMIETFKEGLNPYSKEVDFKPSNNIYTSKKALEYALTIKKKTVGPRTYKDYEGRANAFMQFLKSKKLLNQDIKLIDRKIVSDYLDTVLKKNSARTRNNVRADLSSLFTILADKFIIDSNFIKNDISKSRTQSKTDRRFTLEQMRDISTHLQKENPHLLLFIKVISYNFLRAVEACRLTVGDIDLESQEMYFQQKTKSGKTKYIPNIYFNELKELIQDKPNHFTIFTYKGEPFDWNIKDQDKRNTMGRHFKKVKQKLKIEGNYSFHSFRHFYITATYIVLRKKKGMTDNEAVQYLMKITGHISEAGIRKYIHVNDADRPDDWSDLIDFKL